MTLSFNLNDMRSNLYEKVRKNMQIMKHKTKHCKLEIYKLFLITILEVS